MEAMLGISQLAKTLCLSYYCLYFLFNKIRDKGRTDSAWKRGVCGGEGRGRYVHTLFGEMAQTMYAHMNKRIKKKHVGFLFTFQNRNVNFIASDYIYQHF
jgi:hypothetical protein